MKTTLRVLFGAILAFMLVTTTWASLQQNLFEGGAQMLASPWGWMTLFDAYLGFITFYVWVAYKERSTAARALWFVAIMLLGNIAMAFYVLLELAALPSDGTMRDLLVGRAA